MMTSKFRSAHIIDNKQNFDPYSASYENIGQYIPNDLAELVRTTAIQFNNPCWIVKELLYNLSDDNPIMAVMGNEKLSKLANLAVEIAFSIDNVWNQIVSGKLKMDTLYEYTRQDRWVIDAADGERVATKNEIDEGIVYNAGRKFIELKNKPIESIENSQEIFLNMFMWLISGYWRYYLKAGYKVEWTKDRALKESVETYILNVENVLLRMCELFSTNYFDNLINKLKYIKKLGKYKYPEYASDEIEADNKIIFVINQVGVLMPKKPKSTIQSKAFGILKRNKGKSIQHYTVEEKILLRKCYYELKDELNNGKFNGSFERSKDIEDICNTIREAAVNGTLPNTDFSLKIVQTLMNKGYVKCSERQMAILVEALNKIKKAEKQNEQIKAIEAMSDDDNDQYDMLSLTDISDLLGSGGI